MCAFDTLLDVVKTKEKLLWLHTIQPILFPKSKVDGSRCASIVANNLSDTFLLGDHLHSPTRLGGYMWQATNMPLFVIGHGFLNNNDAMKAKFGM